MARKMRSTLGLLSVGGLLACLGCRQLAGIDDVTLAEAGAMDATHHVDARADSRERDRDPVEAGPCSCAGCTTLADHLDDQPLSVVIHGSYAYVMNYGPEDGTGSIVRVPTKGGKVETVRGNLNRPFSLVEDGTNFYWQAEDGTSTTPGTVLKMPIAGGAVETLASGLPPLKMLLSSGVASIPTYGEVAVTPDDVYFVGFAPGMTMGPTPQGVLTVPIEGGTASRFLWEPPNGDGGASPPDGGLDGALAIVPTGLVTDGKNLFVGSVFPTVGVVGVALPGGPARTLIDNLENPWSLGLFGNDVLLCDDSASFTTGTLQTVPKSGGPPKILVHDGSCWAVAGDGKDVFLIDLEGFAFGAGSIKAYDGAKKTLTTLAGGLGEPSGLAFDSESVYWTDPYCGTLMKVAKPPP